MNYYQFHIGDFRSGTVNMSRLARWIYRDMIDSYYDTEQPLPSDMDVLCDMLGVENDEERKIVERHLRFKFELTDTGYRHAVCDSVIAEYRSKADVARANGKKGGRPRANQIVTQENPAGFENNQAETGLKTNQEPITTNQEEIKSSCDQQAESPKGAKFSYRDIQDAYNEICSPTFPACAVMNDKRKRQIKAMGAIEFMGSKPFTMGIEVWRQYFADCLTDPHWCGQNDRGWRADFDFVTNTKNVIKLMERMN
jgi:uncharacterized protein YdaU (DUF1376 family)